MNPFVNIVIGWVLIAVSGRAPLRWERMVGYTLAILNFGVALWSMRQ